METGQRKILFVSGTGTGIGKTLISAILTEALEADYWKPVQAGYDSTTDSEWVRNVVTNKKSVVHPEVYRLKFPASPHIAARKENIQISLQAIADSLPGNDNDLIIEGAGGLMVPLNEREFVADLISLLNVPIVLVSRNLLGSINFSLLTAMACKQKNIRVIGWMFNDNYLDYEQDIVSWTGIPALGSVPFVERADAEFVLQQASIVRKKIRDWTW